LQHGGLAAQRGDDRTGVDSARPRRLPDPGLLAAAAGEDDGSDLHRLSADRPEGTDGHDFRPERACLGKPT
jgi:hypothetical protein